MLFPGVSGDNGAPLYPSLTPNSIQLPRPHTRLSLLPLHKVQNPHLSQVQGSLLWVCVRKGRLGGEPSRAGAAEPLGRGPRRGQGTAAGAPRGTVRARRSELAESPPRFGELSWNRARATKVRGAAGRGRQHRLGAEPWRCGISRSRAAGQCRRSRNRQTFSANRS